ncbi:hypothetical protein GCM10023333_31560 [Ferrimonas pelagia]|uniref:Uncharacterized protein n=1 Tax=Ferrimonas pelagia TaxID=1177826 RepID=A0ABP9F9J1_9GAMM
MLAFDKAALPAGAEVRLLGWSGGHSDHIGLIANNVSHPLGYAKSYSEFLIEGSLAGTQTLLARPLLGHTQAGSSGSALISAKEQALGVLSAGQLEPPYLSTFSSLERAYHLGFCEPLTGDPTCSDAVPQARMFPRLRHRRAQGQALAA